MNTVSVQKTRVAIESAFFVAVMWGGAWALGFVLGFG